MLSALTSAAKKAGNNIKYNLEALKDNIGTGIWNTTTPIRTLFNQPDHYVPGDGAYWDAEIGQKEPTYMSEAQYDRFLKRLTTPRQYKRFKPILNRGGEIPMDQTGNKLNTVYSFSNSMDSISSNQPVQSNAIQAGDGISEQNLKWIGGMDGRYTRDDSGNFIPNYTVTTNQSPMGGDPTYTVTTPAGTTSKKNSRDMATALNNNQVNYVNADGQPFQMQEGGELPQYLNPQAPVQKGGNGMNIYLSDGSMAEIEDPALEPNYIQTPMSDGYYIETYKYMNPKTGASDYFRNYKKGELPTEESKRPINNAVDQDKYYQQKKLFVQKMLRANPLKWKRTPGGYSNY